MECSPLDATPITVSPYRDALAVEDRAPLDDADGEPREVVFPRRVHPRELRRLAAEERAPGLVAALGDAADDGLGDADLELPRAEVVEEEERPRARRHDVVHAHRDEIDPDGVVNAGGESDLQLGADAVGAADEDGLLHPRGDGAQPREASDVGEDLGDPRALREGRDAVHERVAGVDVDPRVLVRDGHRRRSSHTSPGTTTCPSSPILWPARSLSLQKDPHERASKPPPSAPPVAKPFTDVGEAVHGRR